MRSYLVCLCVHLATNISVCVWAKEAMTVIDGINVAVYKCDSCGGDKMLIFKGMNGEGYKVACVACHADQRDLVREMDVRYLWAKEEGRP